MVKEKSLPFSSPAFVCGLQVQGCVPELKCVGLIVPTCKQPETRFTDKYVYLVP